MRSCEAVLPACISSYMSPGRSLKRKRCTCSPGFLGCFSLLSSGGDTGARVLLGEPLYISRARALLFPVGTAFSFTSVKGDSFGNTTGRVAGRGARWGNLSYFQMSYITHYWGAVRSTCSLILPICSCFSLFSPCCFLSFI